MKLYNGIPMLLMVGVILLSGCTQYGTQPTAPTKPSTTLSRQPAPTGEVKELTVKGSEYKFSPPSIRVNKGDRVRITFRNVGSIGHNFGLSELGVRTRTISPGTTETVEFIASKNGVFTFDCSVPGHRSAGMEGELIVK